MNNDAKSSLSPSPTATLPSINQQDEEVEVQHSAPLSPPPPLKPLSPKLQGKQPASNTPDNPATMEIIGKRGGWTQIPLHTYQFLFDPQPKPVQTAIRKCDFGLIPIPKNRRYDPKLKPEEQFIFSWRLNLLFAASATCSVMNLYYIQPMLVHIASDFGVSYNAVSRIPTLSQGGYGVGILTISTMGDLVRRRQLVLLLMFCTTTLSIGLALAPNPATLEGLSFLVGMLTVTPQICIPWTADLAPSNRRARAMSITLSGLITGLVIGRVLAGVISNFASWRDTYWLAVGVQGLMLGVMWLGLPDTPDKDIGMSYFGVLWSMAKYYVTYPTLAQACLIAIMTSAVFSGFWTDLTFLLSAEPYHYNSLTIGLIGLLGLIGALLAPQWGRIVDKVVPWLGQLCGTSISLTSMIIALAAAERSFGGIAVPIILYDCGQQFFQVSSSYRIAGIDPKARARLNGCYLLAVFVGQTSGTAILTKIYNDHGWTPTGATTVAFVGTGILILFCRGPYETRWVGWRGGFRGLLKKEKMVDLSPNALTEKLHRKVTKTDKEGGVAMSPSTGQEPARDIEIDNIDSPREGGSLPEAQPEKAADRAST